jgi:hypothetical protein
MGKSVEELLIFRIENDLRGLRTKRKTFADINIDMNRRLERLKNINPNMADDLESKYLKQCNFFKK